MGANCADCVPSWAVKLEATLNEVNPSYFCAQIDWLPREPPPVPKFSHVAVARTGLSLRSVFIDFLMSDKAVFPIFVSINHWYSLRVLTSLLINPNLSTVSAKTMHAFLR